MRGVWLLVTALVLCGACSSTKHRSVLRSERVVTDMRVVDLGIQLRPEVLWSGKSIAVSVSASHICALRRNGYAQDTVQIDTENDLSIAGLILGVGSFAYGIKAIDDLGGVGALLLPVFASPLGATIYGAIDEHETKKERGEPYYEKSAPRACHSDQEPTPLPDRSAEIAVFKDGVAVASFATLPTKPVSLEEVLSAVQECGGLTIEVAPVTEGTETRLTVESSLDAPLTRTDKAPPWLLRRCCAVDRYKDYESKCIRDCRSMADVDDCFSGETACKRAAKTSSDVDAAVEACDELFDECLAVKDVTLSQLARCMKSCSFSRAEKACASGL